MTLNDEQIQPMIPVGVYLLFLLQLDKYVLVRVSSKTQHSNIIIIKNLGKKFSTPKKFN